MPLLAVRGNGPAGAYGFGAASGKAAAMTAIASNTLSTTTASVTFSSIPSTYDDLMIVVYGRNTSGASTWLRFNSDTASNYSVTWLYGDGSSAISSRVTSQTSLYSAIASSPVMAQTIHVLNYANTTNFKTTINRTAQDNNGTGYVDLTSGLWRSTSAITSITIGHNAYDFQTGSVFALYGIKKAA